uniref:Uncharacterized protein n=1 Tax=Anguilla anguilla TaxID=7936 RepID=A0A0E9URE7_ANGAN
MAWVNPHVSQCCIRINTKMKQPFVL